MVTTPQIVVPSTGFHNDDLEAVRRRMERSRAYKDCSTIMLVPAIAAIPPKVVQSWLHLLHPMNQKFVEIFLMNMEVGHAYNEAIKFIVNHPDLSNWRYILTVETDNIPPPDGHLKLIEDIESGPYDAVGGIYFTKGFGGMPMCYGKTEVLPRNFIPWLPPQDTVAPCNGLGMGFTLFRISYLKDKRFEEKGWFKTVQEWEPSKGAAASTQDLWHFDQAARFGYRFACSTRVRVGHYSQEDDMVW